MSKRIVRISKVGKSTIVKLINDNKVTEVFVINKLTNINLSNNVITIVVSENRHLFIQYEEIENKLSSIDFEDYLDKAAALFLFNQ